MQMLVVLRRPILQQVSEAHPAAELVERGDTDDEPMGESRSLRNGLRRVAVASHSEQQRLSCSLGSFVLICSWR
eukprot:9438773-Pyramimonas_sp.AAC.1